MERLCKSAMWVVQEEIRLLQRTAAAMEAAYPEAVQRRRAEAVSALATAELQQLVSSDPPAESHQASVQVRCAPKLRCP